MSWHGIAAEYDRSFARLCAGSVNAALDAVGELLAAPRAHDAAGDDDAEPGRRLGVGSSLGARRRPILLDAGCGTGVVAIAARDRGWSVSAVDREASMVEFAQTRAANHMDPMGRAREPSGTTAAHRTDRTHHADWTHRAGTAGAAGAARAAEPTEPTDPTGTAGAAGTGGATGAAGANGAAGATGAAGGDGAIATTGAIDAAGATRTAGTAAAPNRTGNASGTGRPGKPEHLSDPRQPSNPGPVGDPRPVGDPGIRFAVADLAALPFEPGAVDAVVANFSLNHADHPDLCAAELRRVTRRGGRLAATVWPWQPTVLNRLWTELMYATGTRPPNFALPAGSGFERTELGLGGLLSDAGWTVERAERLSWSFAIDPAALWSGIAAGLATIGQAYRGTDAAGRRALELAYRDRIVELFDADGLVRAPVEAVLVVARA